MTPVSSLCSAKVWDNGAWASRGCGRIATVERNGVPYCGIHDPVYREKRNEQRSSERRQKLDASLAESKERNRKLADYPRLEAENRKLREALEKIAAQTCSCMSTSDDDWHADRCKKKIAREALRGE